MTSLLCVDEAANDRHSTPMWRASIVGSVLGALAVAPLIAMHVLIGGSALFRIAFDFFAAPYLWMPAFLVGIVIHEAIHGLSWAWLSGHRLRVIRFGFQWRTFTPFAHCEVPIPATVYRMGTALPGILTGVLPAVLGALFGLGWLAVLGWLLTLSAGGDLLVLLLLRGVAGDTLIEDHPTRAGCVVRS